MDACLPCFGSRRRDEDREPLLPSHHQVQRPAPTSHQPPSPDEPLNKLVDVLAALSAGKLPSQAQINTFLRRVLNSNILQESQYTQGRTTPHILHGNGPLSKRGRKVIQDLVEFIEAFLQFGMEKNDDDLLQDLFAQLWQIETDESPVSLLPSCDAAQEARELRKEAGKLKENIQHQAPDRSEISDDAKAMVESIKSLITSFLTSSIFRLILADAIAIGRELVAHAASDVSSAALSAHSLAEDVERKAAQDNFGRSAEPQEDVKLKAMASSVVEEGKVAATDAAQGMRESAKEKREKWEEHITEEEVKRKLLTRIQKMVTRAQEDPSSRRAVIAILHVIRKYAHRFALVSQQVTASVKTGVASPPSERDKNKSGTQGGVTIGFADPSYPPQPYGPPPPNLIPGIQVELPHLQYVLQDMKLMLERLAHGHKIDNLMGTFGEIVKHSVAAPPDFRGCMEKVAQEKSWCDQGELPSVGATRRAQDAHRWLDVLEQSSGASNGDRHEGTSLFTVYFSSLGQYFDKAMTRPGWVTSRTGQKALETLYDATQELLCMAGEVMAQAEVGRAKDLNKTEMEVEVRRSLEDKEASEVPRMQAGRNAPFTEERAKDACRVTDHWIKDIATFLKQAGDYIDAMERDRTTMRLAHALEALYEDIEDVFGVERQEMGKATGKFKIELQHRAQSTSKLELYTRWLGWVLPRLLHLLPLGAIPIPRVEVKTDNVECAIDALWIRGLASQDNQSRGGYGTVSGRRGAAPSTSWQDEEAGGSMISGHDEGGIGGKLVPDEVLIRQWTELKVTLAEGLGAAAVGANDAQYQMGLAGGPRNEAVPGIEATSRMRMRMDGFKACIRGMGYYFKYDGTWFNYEDEGVLSMDLGTARDGGGRHSGFGLDVVLEMDSSDVQVDFHAANRMTGIPILVVEDVDLDSELDSDVPQNLDIQERHPEHPPEGSEQVRLPGDVDVVPGSSKLSIDVALANAIPLFQVVSVGVDMRGVKIKIDKSRHWLLNKLFVEPFGTSFISTAAEHALEERVQKALKAISVGMALIITEAKERALCRHVKYLAKIQRTGGGDGEAHEEVEDGNTKISDFYASLIERGPEILSYYIQGPEPSPRERARRKSVITETHTELTGKGVVFSKQTHTHIQHQPRASGSMTIPPPGLLDDEGGIEDYELLREQEEESEDSSEDEQIEGLTVAVGSGPQLFPGKGGPYGVPKSTRGAGKRAMRRVREGVEELRDEIQEGYQRAKGRVEAGQETMVGTERRFTERRERERERVVSNWRSSVFDF